MERSLPMRGRKRPPPSPSHHPRIPSIRPRTARRDPAFLVGRIDLANNFAITPLQSHPSEIRRSDLAALDKRGAVARHDGDVDAAMPKAAKVFEAVYEAPIIAHATM